MTRGERAETFDVIAAVDMLPRDENGRRQATAGRVWSCRLKIEGRQFEVRLVNEVSAFTPGESTTAKVTFLNWRQAAPFVRHDLPFEIWELGLVARGRISLIR